MDGVSVDYLANHLAAVPELARYAYDEWRQIYDARGEEYQDVLDACRARAKTDGLPLGLVALYKTEVVVTAALKTHDLEIQPALTPWLAGVFVVPKWRRKGIGTL